MATFSAIDKTTGCSTGQMVQEKFHSGERSYKCTLCDKAFPCPGKLRLHLRVHTDERPYKCVLCDKAFARSTNRQTHMRTHTGERPYKCEYCGKAFKQSSKVTRHMKVHLRDRSTDPLLTNRKHHSDTRSYEFQYLSHHMLTLNDKRFNKLSQYSKTYTLTDPVMARMNQSNHVQYHCNEHSKLFPDLSSMQLQMRSHTDERRYNCNEGDEIFTVTNSQQSNMNINSKDITNRWRKYSDTSTKSSQMTSKMISNTEERPDTCDESDKIFARVGIGATLTRFKSEEKHYECQHTTSTSSLLIEDMECDAREEVKCFVCERSFVDISYLRSHMAVHTAWTDS